MTFRRLLFWTHLTAGSIAGLVILTMAFTGALLAYERQIVAWVDRGYQSVPPSEGAQPMSPGSLVAAVCAAQSATPTAFTLHSATTFPTEAEFGRERVVYFDVYSGRALGLRSQRTRAFFQSVEGWHRWLAVPLNLRPLGRRVTGFCNLAFFVLLLSGLYLWWPRNWSWSRLRQAASWKWEAPPGRSRSWNWHTATGFWCAVPLVVIVFCSIVMAYPWANNLLYRAAGDAPPPPPNQQQGPREAGARTQGAPCAGWDAAQLDHLWLTAERQDPGWRTISMRPPANGKAPVVFAIDRGNGGQPQKRSQLSLNWQNGEVIRWEPFSSYSRGRRWRTWIRFSHTGESAGLFGQTIAALAAVGTTLLGFTGLFMALRRLMRKIFNAWTEKRRELATELRQSTAALAARRAQPGGNLK